MDDKPAGFRVSSTSGVLQFYRERYRHLLPLLARTDPSLARGRTLTIDRLGAPNIVLKHYFRGGLVRFLGDRYLTARPIRREIAISEHLRARGVGALEIVAAEARRSFWGWCRLTILSWEIPGARRLADVLREARGSARSRFLRSVAVATREMHLGGVFHGDLHVENILLSPAGVHFVDFDRSRILDPVPRNLQVRDLRRLLRSARKRGIAVSRADVLRFLRGYAGVDAALRGELGFDAGDLSR